MLRAKINNEEEEEDLVVVMWKLCFQGAFLFILKTATNDDLSRPLETLVGAHFLANMTSSNDTSSTTADGYLL